MANLSNKLTEVTAPAESHISGISEWGHLPPTYTRTFGQEGGQSLSPLAMLSTTDWPRPTCWVQRDGADAEAGPEGEAGAEDDPGHAGRAHEGAGDPGGKAPPFTQKHNLADLSLTYFGFRSVALMSTILLLSFVTRKFCSPLVCTTTILDRRTEA